MSLNLHKSVYVAHLLGINVQLVDKLEQDVFVQVMQKTIKFYK